jgi:enoyl-CoA hydratase/carnithine racemase
MNFIFKRNNINVIIKPFFKLKRSIKYFSSLDINNTNKLINKHNDYLNLVENHGDGNITINPINDKTTNDYTKVSEIIINNSKSKNAISGKMMKQFAIIVDDLLSNNNNNNNNNKPIAILIRGSDDIFCSGADLNLSREIVNTSERGILMCNFMTDMLTRLRNSGYIIVNILNGKCIGGGAELCTVGDFRVMTSNDNAYIQFVHAKLGASPGWGGSNRLTSIIGRKNSLRLLASSCRINVNEAIKIGLVDKILPKYQVDLSIEDNKHIIDNYILEYLRPYLIQIFPESVYAIKQSVAAADVLSLNESQIVDAEMFGNRWGSNDNLSAIKK